MTKTLNQIIFFFLHQNLNFFFSNIGNQNNFLEKKTYPLPPFKLSGRSPNSHDIILGGDIDEDLNDYKPNKPRNEYLKQFIHELNLQYENRGYIFTNSKGCECSELDYFIYNIDSKSVLDKKSVLRIDTNPSDHFPISMTIKWNYHTINNSDNTTIRGNTKWEKVDKDLYKAIIGDNMTKLKQKLVDDKSRSSSWTFY